MGRGALNWRALWPWAAGLAIGLAGAGAEYLISKGEFPSIPDDLAYQAINLFRCVSLGVVIWAARCLGAIKAAVFVVASFILALGIGAAGQGLVDGIQRLPLPMDVLIALVFFAMSAPFVLATLAVAAGLGAFERRRPLVWPIVLSIASVAVPIASLFWPHWFGVPPIIVPSFLRLAEWRLLDVALTLSLYLPLASGLSAQQGKRAAYSAA